MPSKLKKAIGAVKDQTSISLAKASNTNASYVEVLILKVTRHDEAPIDDRYVNEILQMIAYSKVNAVACAQVISKRIGKTRNWIVALKSLMLVLRIFQDGDRYFPREVVHSMKRGHKILNISNFRDDSHSSPWDYTAFVRTFALYLDERLDCFVTGKLHRRFSNRAKLNGKTRRSYEAVREMKPLMLLDRISDWQRLLDRAIGTKPTGSAKNNRLVQFSLYAIVQESFDLYKDISDALALLLDSFFHLQYENCVSAFQACVKASKQFKELCSFYDLCRSIDVGRISEYPSVQKVSDELIETLQEFLKDQASFPAVNGRPALMLHRPPPRDPGSSSFYSSESTEKESEYGSQGTLRKDFRSEGTSPNLSIDIFSNSEQSEKPSQENNSNSFTECLDLIVFEDWTPRERKQGEESLALESSTGARDDWELVLVETATNPVEILPGAPIEDKFAYVPESQYNPFLQEEINVSSSLAITHESNEQATFPIADAFSVASTFQFHATPTFSGQNPSQSGVSFENKDDLFGLFPAFSADKNMAAGSADQKLLLQEQQLWLQSQN